MAGLKTSPEFHQSSLSTDARTLCQALLRIDTTNPPGNERPAADLVDRWLREAGYEPVILESAPGRANLVCRRPGSGKAAPLLLTAHLDVVEADPSEWKHPPFSGIEADGCLWGRGAVDMKHMVAMVVAVFRQLARDNVTLDRDLIFAAVADEEAGCDLGSRFLVEEHRSLVEAEYAIGESGGFSMHVGAATFYPIQVAEKGLCWIRARARGEAGHGSMPRADSAVIRLAEAIVRLGKTPLPAHATDVARRFLQRIAAAQPVLLRPLSAIARHPSVIARALRAAPDSQTTRGVAAMLANTAAPTVVRAGDKINVIPGTAEVLIDGRTLPGQTEDDLLRELADVLGPDIELTVEKSLPPVVTDPIDSPLLDTIRREILSREPDAHVIPYLIPGYTDAKYFTRTGARWYGFSPVKIEKHTDIRFADMFHGVNERVPIAGLAWGADLLCAVVRSFCGAKES
ncbi:MAG TPA: M20/M25/M40 family metallo-hydrolase [Kofleriaceae bacterium]|nr:M20/M25/M40 family metallo-hydrolase [Kofleriaceae bacterium]